jgi:hypothetical protein
MSDWLAVGLNWTRISSVGPPGSAEAVEVGRSVIVAAAVGLAVAVALALGAAVGVAVAVGLALGAAVEVEVGVAVAVDVGAASAGVAVVVGKDGAIEPLAVVGEATVNAAGEPAAPAADVVVALVCVVAVGAVVLVGTVSAAAIGTAATGSTRLNTMASVAIHDHARDSGVRPDVWRLSVSYNWSAGVLRARAIF